MLKNIIAKKKRVEKKKKRERRKRVFFCGEKLKILHHIYTRKFDKYQGDTDFQVEKFGLYHKRMPSSLYSLSIHYFCLHLLSVSFLEMHFGIK